MGNYLTEIDPVGESNEDALKVVDVEHDLICNTGTSITRLLEEINNLNIMIEEYKTYTNNTFFLSELQNLRMRMLTHVVSLEKNFNDYVDYNESKTA